MKNTFKAWAYRAWSYAAGALRGVAPGPPARTVTIVGEYRPGVTVAGAYRPTVTITGDAP